MGNQQASNLNSEISEKGKIRINIKSKNNENSKENTKEITKDSISTFNGIKSKEISLEKIDYSTKESTHISTKESNECETIPENLDFKDQEIPTLFEWKEGGENVYIAGDFSNWSQWHLMNKINNKFELFLVK